jgi:hypothetical protein
MLAKGSESKMKNITSKCVNWLKDCAVAYEDYFNKLGQFELGILCFVVVIAIYAIMRIFILIKNLD